MDNAMRGASRRSVLLAGAAGTLSLMAGTRLAFGQDKGDLAILQAAHDLESQAIWAYGAAAGKLSKTDVGKTVLELALRNQADHKSHRAALADAIKSLGATPAPAKDSYDLSAYLKAGEGGLDSDANIAKLALALEIDAALAYQAAFGKLKTPALQAAASSILPAEAGHATAIRAVFHGLLPTVQEVPAAFLSAQTRKDWILKV
ncbi:MAG: ferritin-like domain-containing protein [Aphanocapsa lilacina HA4352-LM1]|jgi:rubrerythrin|nr:ferritin-like domain-containing protein [Aphanocapsa lilacina HA4352-LM1]